MFHRHSFLHQVGGDGMTQAIGGDGFLLQRFVPGIADHHLQPVIHTRHT